MTSRYHPLINFPAGSLSLTPSTEKRVQCLEGLAEPADGDLSDTEFAERFADGLFVAGSVPVQGSGREVVLAGDFLEPQVEQGH